MKKAVIIRIFALIAAAALLITVCGCGAKKDTSKIDDSLQKVLDAGRFVLGVDTEFPPMSFIDEIGEIVGFDIDIAKEVCERLGISLVTQPIDWETKEDALNSGEIDCIWSGMSVTPARAESMTLSDPYVKNDLIFVVDGDSDIFGLDDLKGKKVGVQSGNSTQEVLEDSELRADFEVVTFNSNMELMQSLASKDVDAAFVDSLNAYYFISSSDEQFFVLPDGFSEEECAIGFRKDDQELRDAVQNTISMMKADGTLGEISKKWFGSDITTVK
ncbi:MAG: amino acid ABC transporter substrate-binding protein [Clostridia bacterium]|nr:amino acid ABC transporter substrate-binding protein [Clostridia bacterium]